MAVGIGGVGQYAPCVGTALPVAPAVEGFHLTAHRSAGGGHAALPRGGAVHHERVAQRIAAVVGLEVDAQQRAAVLPYHHLGAAVVVARVECEVILVRHAVLG